MNRDLRFYFLVIGLPALLLALGGLRLLYVESQRTYALGRDALKAKATLAAADVRRRIREHMAEVQERAEQLPNWTTNSFTAFVETEPLVRSVSAAPRVKDPSVSSFIVSQAPISWSLFSPDYFQ